MGEDRLLDGMRVLDAGIWRPVPHATQLLVDLGAEVLKIEPPGGDPMRVFPELFSTVNGHKGSVVLDLKDPDDRARALELAAEADVFTEGFRPGVAERLGLGYEALKAVNPAIVYCSISGFGATGEHVALPGHDVNYQAMSGFLVFDDEGRPGLPVHPVADLLGGTTAALTICAAWARALRTGKGERIDVSMTDVLVHWLGPFPGSGSGSARSNIVYPGYGIFRARDGQYLALGTITEDHLWKATCVALGLGGIAGVLGPERTARAAELRAQVEAEIALLERDEACALLARAGAPASPVLQRDDVLKSDFFKGRGVVSADPDGSPVMTYPAVLTETEPQPPGRAPALDANRGRGFVPRAAPRREPSSAPGAE